MKIIHHKSDERGLTDNGWLYSRHSFSFGGYYDPLKVHFGLLRVINDDIVKPGEGFGTHPHQDMEIISIPLSGTLQHTDSQGNSSQIRKGDIQVMTAGTGILHSEYNHSLTEDVCFLQIWVFPEEKGLKPGYSQISFEQEKFKNRFFEVVSPKKSDQHLSIKQNAYFSLGNFEHATEINYKLHDTDHGIYIFVIEGEAECENVKLGKRDGLGISEINETILKISAGSSILLIEVPMNQHIK